MKDVTVTLKVADAEPILRKAAEDAAKFGGWYDYIDRRTYNSPSRTGEPHDKARKRWREQYLAAKRIVAAFGIEAEETSEEEALTVYHPYKGGKRVPFMDGKKPLTVPGFGIITRTVGSEPDYNDPHPYYRGDVHAEACRQAAARTVRNWHASLAE